MRSVHAQTVMATSKFSKFHLGVFFWCAFSIIFDGYDLNLYGVVLPVLMQEWNLTPVQAGAMGSYALLGMMAGAFVFAPLADKIGRKKVLIICITLFSIATALVAFSPNPTIFSILRMVAGLGLGGLMPNVIALMTEYSPKKIRSILVAAMYSGYAIGGIMAALLGMYVMPVLGWQSIFWVGAIPLLVLPWFIKHCPESMSFYILKKQNKELCRILNQVDPNGQYKETDEFQFEAEKAKAQGSPVKKLFEEKRARSTFLFWMSTFCCLIMVYGLNTWLPKLMLQAGYPMGSSLSFMLTLNLGSIAGSLIGGWLSDKLGAKKIIIAFYLIGALCFVLLGFKSSTLLLYLFVGVGGACTIGTQNLANPYITEFYPKEMRSTGIGWSLGIGRIGAILGPTLGGFLLSLSLPLQSNFLVFAIPCLLGAVALTFIQEKYGSFDSKKIETNEWSKESVI